MAGLLFFVMPGFMPGIHVLVAWKKQDVGSRNKCGHDTNAKNSGHDEMMTHFSACLPGVKRESCARLFLS
jgi:hypothetical protein